MDGGQKDSKSKNARDARLRAALRSNLARRKAQARARADDDANSIAEPEKTGQSDEDES